MNTQTQVFERFAEIIGVGRESLSQETVIADIVRDSLTYFELFLELEKELNKSLSFDDVIEIKTLGDAIAFIEQEKHAPDTKK